MAPGPVLLSDPILEYDRLTAKLYAFYGLSNSDGWRNDGLTTALDLNNLLTLMRWRLDRGLARMEHLSLDWFEEYCGILSTAGALGLVPSEARMRAYLVEVTAGRIDFPTRRKGCKLYIDIKRVCATLGFSNSRQLSSAAREALRSAVGAKGLSIKGLDSAARREGAVSGGDGLTTLSVTRMAPLLAVWERLYALRHRMAHDPLGFDPFEAGSTPYRLAQSLGARLPGRTPTLPAEQSCFLVDRALRWVLAYADDLKTLHQSLHADFDPGPSSWSRAHSAVVALEAAMSKFKPIHIASGAPGAPWPLAKRTGVATHCSTSASGELPLHTVYLELLPAAVAIVIATFAARRREELESLRPGCIVRGEGGEAWLRTWIGKSGGSVELIPVPEVVAKAVDVLDWLGKTDQGEQEWLFDLPRLLSAKGRVRFSLIRKLDPFASFVGMPPGPDGRPWPLTPHQLRRFFAITYYWRYRYPSLTALSDFLRHNDPDITRRYITETAGGGLIRMGEERRVRASNRAESMPIKRHQAAFDDFEDVRREFMADRFRNVATGLETMGGFGGERLKAELQELVHQAKQLVEIRSSKEKGVGPTFDELLVEFVRDRRLEPAHRAHRPGRAQRKRRQPCRVPDPRAR